MKGKTAAKKAGLGIMNMNPMIRRISGIEERDAEHCATYAGIAVKTMIFMLAAVVGAVGYFYLHDAFEGSRIVVIEEYSFYLNEGLICLAALAASIFAPALAMLIRPLLAVFGILYCASVGYMTVMAATLFGAEYARLIYIAIGLTILLVTVMAFLYASGLVRPGEKFRTVVTVLFVTSVCSGLIGFLLSQIPGVKEIVNFAQNSPVLTIVLGIVYIVIACAFLLVDFDTIQRTVEDQLPKKYEWTAAFGLAYTIIYLFFKILDLLAALTQKKD